MSFVLGPLLLALGLVMLVTPGPGLLVIVLGAAMLARESLVVARMLDRLHAWIHPAWVWLRRRWSKSGPTSIG